MAIQIISEEYGPRKPLVNCTADSVEELAGLVCAEGSTATVGGTKYTLDRTQGWVEPGSGGGGGTGGGVLVVHDTNGTLDKTWQEIADAFQNTGVIISLQSPDQTPNLAGISSVFFDIISEAYEVDACNGDTYTTKSAGGYPELIS